MEINLNGLDAVQKFFVHDIFITFNIKFLILFIGLIQSHGQARTASPAFVEKDSDRFDLFTVKIGRNLFSGRWGYF